MMHGSAWLSCLFELVRLRAMHKSRARSPFIRSGRSLVGVAGRWVAGLCVAGGVRA